MDETRGQMNECVSPSLYHLYNFTISLKMAESSSFVEFLLYSFLHGRKFISTNPYSENRGVQTTNGFSTNFCDYFMINNEHVRRSCKYVSTIEC